MLIPSFIPGRYEPLKFFSFFSGGLGKSCLGRVPLLSVVACPSIPALFLSVAGVWRSCPPAVPGGETRMAL